MVDEGDSATYDSEVGMSTANGGALARFTLNAFACPNCAAAERLVVCEVSFGMDLQQWNKNRTAMECPECAFCMPKYNTNGMQDIWIPIYLPGRQQQYEHLAEGLILVDALLCENTADNRTVAVYNLLTDNTASAEV